MKRNTLLVMLGLFGLIFISSCGKPTDPESIATDDGGYKVVSRFPSAGYAQDLAKKNNLVYIAQGEGGLLIVDVANAVVPQMVSITNEGVKGYSTGIEMKDSVVYLAQGTYGVSVVNVANPFHTIVTASNLSMKPARNLHVMGNYLFAAISDMGVKIANIELPTQPDIRGGASTPGYARDLVSTPDSSFLLVACGEMGCTMFNIKNFQQGYGTYPVAGWCDTPGYAESIALMDDKPIAFVACGTSGLQIVDFSDTTNIHIVGSFDGGGFAKKLKYEHHKVYMAAELGGLQIIDVSNLTNPILIGKVNLQYALGVDADEKYIYVADEIEGLVIVSKP